MTDKKENAFRCYTGLENALSHAKKPFSSLPHVTNLNPEELQFTEKAISLLDSESTFLGVLSQKNS